MNKLSRIGITYSNIESTRHYLNSLTSSSRDNIYHEIKNSFVHINRTSESNVNEILFYNYNIPANCSENDLALF